LAEQVAIKLPKGKNQESAELSEQGQAAEAAGSLQHAFLQSLRMTRAVWEPAGHRSIEKDYRI
jgi:hypothetical protein